MDVHWTGRTIPSACTEDFDDKLYKMGTDIIGLDEEGIHFCSNTFCIPAA